jgi:hypothetical protein
MRAKSIAYWATTILAAFFMSGGVAQILQFRAKPHGTVPELGYPMYFFLILGIWKVLGAIAILCRGRRVRRIRLSRDCPSHHCGAYRGIVGAAAPKPCRWCPFPFDKRACRYERESGGHWLKLRRSSIEPGMRSEQGSRRPNAARMLRIQLLEEA